MKKLLLSLMCLCSLGVHADEGMWTLFDLPNAIYDQMKQYGFQLSQEQLYQSDDAVMKAVVNFGGYCSGVVVSPDGLVFTNHHCGFECIRSHSTVEHDYMLNGFIAKDYSEELPNENLFVSFMVDQKDVTEELRPLLEGLSLSRQAEMVDSIQNAWQKEMRQKDSTLRVELQPFYENNKLYCTTYRDFEDVRLVFAVPKSMGKFGGETDNWMWPRQTCDYSVFRIYADPKTGGPAKYSKDNVPYHPKKWAKVSMDGYKPGDFAMIMGYPGSTSRYLSSYGIKERRDAINAPRVQVRGIKQEIMLRHMRASEAVRIKYDSKYANSSNYWKNSIGMNKAVKELNVIGQKQELEQDIRRWYGKDQQLTARFGTMFDELDKAYADRFEAMRAYGFFSETFMRGIEIRRVAATAASKPTDMDSTEIALAREQAEAFFKDYDPRVDEETMAVLLQNYCEQVDKKYLPSLYHDIDSLFNGDTRAYARDLFSRTALKDISCVDKFVADSTLRDTDPIFAYYESVKEKQTAFYNEIRGDRQTIDYNEHLLTQSILERNQETPHYSDANFSMRLSYGYIQDYTASGQHFDYYTSSQSLLDKAAKQQEIEDYTLEQDIISLIKKRDFGRYADPKDGDLHLCFLSNNDITGGNSGSPMFNGKGELIGLAFDGNWEAMSGDITFNPDLQRCIGVDIRFVLYLIDRWGHADRLIKEMGL